ncbi:MAG TPA: glycosyltransferase [Flavobacterium sp.]|uniref:glycosyltransferase n=1 Tax=Flavobacterium sp. TaxID=239 RepID=UPI002BA2964A|nr:glycosyltransferase [Flavobacterium sp.]HNP31976.1 glycosyltransferase [Flavobacterium sp.]
MKNNNKIAIVSASLGVGGAERFGGLLSFMLHDLGYEVHNIIILDYVDYEYKGSLVNLGKLFANENGIFRAVKKGKYIARYLSENNIEMVIDNRSRPIIARELFTKWIYGNRKKYYFFHSSNLKMYLTNSVFWAKYIFSKATKLVCVSTEIEEKLKSKYQFTNTKTIYNPIIFPDNVAEKPNDAPESYFLFFGRLEEEIKNFSLMLKSFSISKVYETGTKLLIIGDGSGKDFIQTKIKQLNLENHVQLLPFQKNIIPYIQHARYTILTSNFEGFPMSLIESLAVATPVISVDCETGPKEIIQNRQNGLLVPNHDETALAKAIIDMVSDKNLYQTCKNNAQKSVENLSLTNIAQQWKQLLAEK